MLQFDGGQITTADAFPGWPSTLQPAGTVTGAVLGPTQMGKAVLFGVFNNLIDVQVAYRDPDSPGWAWHAGNVISALWPGSYTFPEGVGVRFRSHTAGVSTAAVVIAEVWEIPDGPVPVMPIGPNGAMVPSGGGPINLCPCGSGGGGGATWTKVGANCLV